MLKDRTAIVTGASKGIGKAIAIELAQAGAKVAVNYSSSTDLALETVSIIERSGGIAFAVKASVSSEEETAAMFASVEKEFGSFPDILVNNAGITKDNLLLRMKSEDWDSVLQVNLKGAFLCTKLAVKGMMKKRYGKIINVSSVVGFSGNPGQANYCAAKAGLIGLTKASALELASRGIRVNAVAPGFINTDMTVSLPEEIKKACISKIPMQYIAEPSDVAKAVLYLASADSDYITGQTLHVNGGLYM